MVDMFREAKKIMPVEWLLGGEPFVRYRTLKMLIA